ncbi:P-loop containing nucleoside triphosphate hydrolase protein [Dactylonectria estremocensis]|uniref:P-loop containing nucleoside triphosphate hydrolase protein n=1 Tax=Dactylonectria estremocensis TaxID=1079267 RepID=A0A9P9EMB7_9HYPO|nr:P-loop containing nucleoside triphosphate hydrolase protein [Dactylonectria estremocensis]
MTHVSIPTSMTLEQQATIREYLTNNKRNPINISVLGASGSGRRSILQKLAFGIVPEEYDPTENGEYRKLVHIEECANRLDFSMLLGGESSTQWAWYQLLVRGGDAFFLVYSVTDRASFEALHEFHSKLFGLDEDGKPVWVLAAKMDRPREDWVVSEQEGKAFSRSIGARFRSVSALEGVGLEDDFAAEVVCEVILSKTPRLENAGTESGAPGEDSTQGQDRSSIKSVWNKVNRFMHKDPR